MSIAAFALSEAPISDQAAAVKSRNAPKGRQAVAKADAVAEPEAR